jgi:hypothetical protein
MIVVEGDRIFFEDKPGVIYRVVSLNERTARLGNLEVVESDEPDLFPKGKRVEDVDLLHAHFIGVFAETEG